MKGLFVCILVSLAAAASSAATPGSLALEGHVRLRISTQPARQVVLGQQTRIFVDILTDSWFTKAPRYPELRLDGAVALMPEQLGTNFTERIDGTTFAGQRRSYVVYPQRPGTLEIPAIPVRLGVAVDAKPSEIFTLTTPPLKLQVVLPPEAETVASFVTTPDLQVEETWDRSLDELRVGDALERTVRMTADEVLGMLLPVLDFEAPSGIALYRDQPRVTDSVNRGQYRGERVEAATYVLQRAGEFTLPELRVHWWNTRTGTLETETLEARTLDVSASDREEAGVVARPPREMDWRGVLARALDWFREHGRALLIAGFGVALAAAGLRRYGPTVLEHVRHGLHERRESEGAFFRELLHQARKGDEDAVVRSYWSWRDRLQRETPELDAGRLRAIAESSGFREAWGHFEHARYGGDGAGWDRGALRSSLGSFRKALLAALKPPGPGADSLNPRGPIRP